MIVDPHDMTGDTTLKTLPSDEKDRRVSIYCDYLSYFDNLTHVSNDQGIQLHFNDIQKIGRISALANMFGGRPPSK